jgi:hypothetical protein
MHRNGETKMNITAKYHVTATEKRDIKAIISNGWVNGSTKRKSYYLTKTDYGFEVKIKTPEINDMGKRQVRVSTAYVNI